jgi:hypothetical protein
MCAKLYTKYFGFRMHGYPYLGCGASTEEPHRGELAGIQQNAPSKPLWWSVPNAILMWLVMWYRNVNKKRL